MSQLAAESELRPDIPLPTMGQVCDREKWLTEGYIARRLRVQR
jgi:hypothetical protein